MREMQPDTENAFPSAYLCSECSWSFALGRMSDLGDFFQQKSAVLSFADHECGKIPEPTIIKSHVRTSLVLIVPGVQQPAI